MSPTTEHRSEQERRRAGYLAVAVMAAEVAETTDNEAVRWTMEGVLEWAADLAAAAGQ